MDIVTLVPAYKAQYLPDLLHSLRTQTRRSSKIIFSDDSPGGRYREALFAEALAPLREGLDIECHDGPRRGGYANMVALVDRWGGRSALFHLMLDDDVLYPEFYERHLVAHASARFSCTISRRWTADEQGRPLQGQPAPPAVQQHAHRILSLDAGVMFQTTAVECKNWFGEFSNCVFRGETAPVLFDWQFGGVSYAGLWDLGAFLAASLRAPVGYLQDHLGYFRTGGEGNSGKFFGPYMKSAHLGYVALTMGCQRIGQYTPEQARRCYANMALAMAQRYGSQDDMQPFIQVLPAVAAGDLAAEARFLELWNAYLQQHGF